MRYADPHRCPDCGSPIEPASGSCPSCGLPLAGSTAGRLYATLQEADRLLAALRASAAGAPAPVGVAAAPAASVPGTALGAARSAPQPAGAAGAPTIPADPAAPAAPVRRGLSGASVPRLLLGLGAVCLLVAAVTFLAVAWSWLGVAGRTAVLVGLTVAGGVLAGWLARRGLRTAAESLTVVACGLLALDVAGARDAGWLGGLDEAGLLLAAGATVGAAALAVLAASRRSPLLAPQLVAPLALGVAVVGLEGTTDRVALSAAAGAAAFLGLAVLGRRLAVPALVWAALAGAGLSWVLLVGTGLERMAEHGSYREALLGGHGWPLAAASVLLLGPVLVLPDTVLQRALASGAAALGTLTLLLPAFVGGTAAQASLPSAAALVGWSAALVLLPDRWRTLPLGPALVSATVPALVALAHAATLTGPLASSAPYSRPVSATTGSPFLADPYLLPVLVAALAVALVALSRLTPAPGGPATVGRDLAPVLVGAVLVASLLWLSAYDVPLALLVVALVLVGCLVGLAPAAGIGRTGPALAAAAALAAFTAVVASASAPLLVVALVPVLAGSGWLVLRSSDEVVRPIAEVALALSLAVLAWTVGELAGLASDWRGLLVIAALAGPVLVRPRPSLGVASAVLAGTAAAASFGAAQGDLTVLAWHLTPAGVVTVATALLHDDLRRLAWPGGLLLAAATWARLADLGVEQPEPYTLPSAVALVAVGLWHLFRHPGSTTRLALAPGLLLGTVPSLLWVLAEDPFTPRSVLLGAGCLALVLAGLRLRWSSPVLVGAGVGLLVVLRMVEPYAATLPPWLLIGIAGTMLTVVGVTWESRVRDLRRATGYLGRLR